MIALDSSFVIAFHDSRDAHHAAAKRVMKLADAAIIAICRGRGAGTVATFDSDFRKVRGIAVVPDSAM